jgi:hypothetical protein
MKKHALFIAIFTVPKKINSPVSDLSLRLKKLNIGFFFLGAKRKKVSIKKIKDFKKRRFSRNLREGLDMFAAPQLHN